MRKNATKIFTGLLVLGLLAVPQLSWADWGYGWHGHPAWGVRVHRLPPRYATVVVGSQHYYYYDGVYYTGAGGAYTLVAPPVGAYVTTIPADFGVTVVGGRKYYTNAGVYYTLTRRRGYKVVRAPVFVGR